MSWRASGKAKMIEREINGQVLTAQDKLLLMVLSDDYNDEVGLAWRSQPKLAALCFCTDRGIRLSIDKLEKAGLIEVIHGGRAGNEYRLLFVSSEPVLRNTVPNLAEDNRNVGSKNSIVSLEKLEPPSHEWEKFITGKQKKQEKKNGNNRHFHRTTPPQERQVYESATDRRAREASEQVARILADLPNNSRGRSH